MFSWAQRAAKQRNAAGRTFRRELVYDIGTAEIKYLLPSYTNLDIHVMQVAQRVMNVRGRIIAGTTLPRILRKTGHRE
jgi:hypothetical protein